MSQTSQDVADFNRSNVFWYDDTSPNIVYSGLWIFVPRVEAWFAGLHSTAQVGASATLSFPGPAYVSINISLPLCEDDGGMFMVRAYIHGVDSNTNAVPVGCAGRTGSINHLEFYSNFVNATGTQNATIELVNGGDAVPINGGPLLLDSIGYLQLNDNRSWTTFGPTSTQSTTFTPTQTSASDSVPVTTPDLDAPTSSATNVTQTPAGNTHRPSFSSATIIGISLALLLVFISVFALYRWRRNIRDFIQRPKFTSHSSNSELDMTQVLNRSITPNAPRYSTLGYSPLHHMWQGTRKQSNSESTLDHDTSPNSLFNEERSTSSATFTCILSENAKHDECFCPSCDETRSNYTHQSTSTQAKQISIGRPTSTGVQSHARSSITAVDTDAGYRISSTVSHTTASVNSDPHMDNHAPVPSICASWVESAPLQNPFGDD